MSVFVEKSVLDEKPLLNFQEFATVKDNLRTFNDMKDNLSNKIDFIICIGGDGTLLYASMLFQVILKEFPSISGRQFLHKIHFF